MTKAQDKQAKEAEAREALEEKIAGLEVAKRHEHGDTEGHVEGPVGTWNTSGTEVAKPTSLQRDRYDEQNRNDLPSHGMTAADHAYRRAQAGDEAVLKVIEETDLEPTKAAPMPQNNTTVMAAVRGVSLDQAVNEAKGTKDAPARKKKARR